ncbi:hypothetical protein BpHYR1_004212 [Brachionus plicatilis]|uniref:Uncharacterized protein n=1 Tax=Brachionus plicatilis TaxID=10195 RepID=A0A3M7Q7B0_BRAPC|nr:hypothetical protein BpHYR1_004212 [Brachionus plicatilis]
MENENGRITFDQNLCFNSKIDFIKAQCVDHINIICKLQLGPIFVLKFSTLFAKLNRSIWRVAGSNGGSIQNQIVQKHAVAKLKPFEVARIAQERAAERIAALVGLIAQLQPTLLAAIALQMKVFFHRDDAHSLTSAVCRRDRQAARRALGREQPIKIPDAVDAAVHVQSERQPVQALIAAVASETARMVRLAHRLQYAVHNYVSANVTLFRILQKSRVQIVLFTVDLVVQVVEGLGAQLAATRHTHKASSVKYAAHGQTGVLSLIHGLVALVAIAVVVERLVRPFVLLFDLFLN